MCPNYIFEFRNTTSQYFFVKYYLKIRLTTYHKLRNFTINVYTFIYFCLNVTSC